MPALIRAKFFIVLEAKTVILNTCVYVCIYIYIYIYIYSRHFQGRHFQRLCTQNAAHIVTRRAHNVSSAEGPSALENGECARTAK